MMGSSAQFICAIVILSAAAGSLADKPSKKTLKKVPPSQGRPFIPPQPLGIPAIPPFRIAPANPSPPSLDPYACLPKYLCVVQNKKGEKRTTIVHGLHPALRKAKPNVIDPANLPNIPGGSNPFSPPIHAEGSLADDELFRDREFDDSFLSEQEKAEAMAFLEEKRRQFMYQQGLPKQKIIPKGGEKTEDDDDKKSKESNEEEEEKSQEASKEDKDEEADKSAEVSKEEEKEEPEESPEDDGSSELDAQSRSKLSKYKIKKKMFNTKKRNGLFKTRVDDYDDADDHLATVPWDDRLRRNDSDPLKPSEIYDKLFGSVLPSFQLPKLPKFAKKFPGVKALLAGSEEVTTTTTQRPGLLKRMLSVVTGNSGSSDSQTMKKRNGKPMRRYKRDAAENLKLISQDENAKIVKQIRDPARQCRMIFKGCDLPYDHIMKMVSNGQVLIENDQSSESKPAVAANPMYSTQDDEAEQAVRDKMAQKKGPKPIPQLLAQATLGGKKKFGAYGKKKKPDDDASGSGSEEDDYVPRPKPKKSVASLPLKPMKYQWGKPTYTVNGRPTHAMGEPDFSGGILDPVVYTTPAAAPTTTTTTTERPIFANSPLDKRDNNTVALQQSVIRLNKTHSVHVLAKKPYNPPKTRTRDAKGRPLSFSSVFTEIAGQTGGIHDFFDRISGAFGGDGTRESGRELSSPFPGTKLDIHGRPIVPPSPHAKPTAFPEAPIPPDHIEKDEDGGSPERDDDDASDEEEDEENKEEENEEEEDEEEEEEDIGDDLGPGGAPPPRPGGAPPPRPGAHPHQRPHPPPHHPEEDDEDINPVRVSKPKKPVPQPINQSGGSNLQLQQQIYQLGEKNKPTPDKNKKPAAVEEPEDEEEDEEEGAGDDEDEYDLPDTIPPFIKQSMIEEMKKKKQQAEQGDADDNEEDDEPQQGGPGGPQHGGPQHGGPQAHGRPGHGGPPGPPGQGGPQHGPPKPPPRGGGFLSSLFS